MVNVAGVAVLLLGVAAVAWPDAVARVSERIDAIGSTRSRDAVEPAEWKVTLTRIGGVVLAFVGLALAIGG